MIKKLIFTIALSTLTVAALTPRLAYGQNPTASFSDQVVPAGSDPTPSPTVGSDPPDPTPCDIGVPYTGSVPAPAQAAGFTHCVANFDFTNSFFTTKASWLGSGNNLSCISNTPLLYIVQAGPGNMAPCSDFTLVNDTANGGASQVLKVSNTTADAGVISLVDTVSNYGLPNPPGLHIYNGFYSEEVLRLDASYTANTSCPTGGTQPCQYFDYWTIPYTCPGCDRTMEFDFIEAYAQQGPPNNGAPSAGGAASNTGVSAGGNYLNPGPMTASQLTNGYNTIGEMATIVSIGSPNYGACWYLNGSTIKCGTSTVTSTDITAGLYQIFPAEVGPQGESSSQAPQINQAVYIERLTIWACSNYSTGPCYSSSLVTH
jgi:hypothetical protein